MDISVIAPVFNEEKNLTLFYERVRGALVDLEVEYEIIFVDDGSHDGSLDLIKQLVARDVSVKYISFSRNFGHQIAVSAGLANALGDAIVIIDSDLQDPPELIPELYAKFKDGYDVVYARRRSREGERPMKTLTAKVFYRVLQRITSISIPVDTGDFRIIRKRIAEALSRMPEHRKYLRGQIAWVGFKQGTVDYDRKARHAGETGYNYFKMIRFALDGITSFSDLPLRFATIAGFVVSAAAFLVMAYAFFSRFVLGNYEPGWPSLMVSILFIGGIQLICIGIIGEYISRLSHDVRNRPLYIVEESNITNAH